MSGSAEYALLPTSASTEKILNRRRSRHHVRWALLALAGVSVFVGLSLLQPWTPAPPPPVSLPSPDILDSPHPSQPSNPILDKLFPIGEPDRTDVYEDANNAAMERLLGCAASGDCHRNQTSVVLLASHHFAGSIEGHVSGEDIWAASVIAGLQEMNYTFIYSKNNVELAAQYRQFPDLVKVIIIECEAAANCFSSSDCIKSEHNPLGVPVWKLFSFHFWTGDCHPLGGAWTLSPENYPERTTNSLDNFYLGYSVERTCTKLPVVPLPERENRAYVFGKTLTYFTEDSYAWPGVHFPDAVAGLADSRNDIIAGTGIKNLGRLNKETFYLEVAKSKALVGVGKPYLSPSPYDALCLGVPFINPITRWDEQDPDNRTRWSAQHDGLLWENEPYVYHVRKGDGEGLMAALDRAFHNPIDRYIPRAMTMDALKARLADLIESDWKSRAEEVLEERAISGKGELFNI
ncbi:glycosyltransferase family 18 protein [Neolentinus lepideus HHB14362 ss-1]|uniref:alpha-1,6-mannosyl-glycoprotein 6-beta-N-acetylglucosaminyltransferase n=1 Tax=Neolentinus lepideus HHB14362 ss-1 TaxID=1314782 RepID=A0A165PB61_9AGAM|nr:glycosyltransferase family 18 protein [Neolentinus lepideus HHB14362 ss-1]